LLKTTEYLMREVLFSNEEEEEEGLAENLVYDFVFDRLRAVRQEGKRSKSAGNFYEIIVNLFLSFSVVDFIVLGFPPFAKKH
jgi:hypothetical protein